jgi:K+-sensing histidine kinase KdpD/PAS domain-containing protein
MAGGRIVTARAKDGRQFPIEASISRLELEDGAILSVIVRDATERVTVERALRDREARARRLADALPFPIVRLDRNLDYVFANTAAAAWLGRPVEAISGLSAREAARAIGTEPTFEAVLPDLEAALSGQRRVFVGRARDGHGAVHDVEILVVPSRDDSGTVSGCYVLTLDRTEQRRDEAALRLLRTVGPLPGAALDEEMTLDSALRLAVAGFADDCAAYLERENGSVWRFDARRSPGEPRAVKLTMADLPEAARRVMADGQTRSHTGTDDRATYVVVPLACAARKGGTVVFRWAAPYDVRHADVEIAQELGRRLAAALDHVELTRRLSEAVRARDWLLHKVTHDLGNPVASIIMVAERLLRTAGKPDRPQRTRALLEGIKQQSEEMRVIIEELLDASALRTGRTSVSPKDVDAVGLVRAAVSLLRPIAEQRDVRVVLDVPDPPVRVMADPRHLRHALTALISDQIGWCEPGDRVAARVDRAAGEDVAFEVVGPGPGFLGEEMTSRLDEAVSDRAGPPDGLRLSLPLLIGSELVRAHGSRVVVSEEPDGRTLYRFTLPAAP